MTDERAVQVLAAALAAACFHNHPVGAPHSAPAERILQALPEPIRQNVEAALGNAHHFEPYPPRGTFAEIPMLYCAHCGECRSVTTTAAQRAIEGVSR